MNLANCTAGGSLVRPQRRGAKQSVMCKFVRFSIFLVLSAPTFGQLVPQSGSGTPTPVPQFSAPRDPVATEQEIAERSLIADQLIRSKEMPGRVFEPVFRRHLLTELSKLSREEL